MRARDLTHRGSWSTRREERNCLVDGADRVVTLSPKGIRHQDWSWKLESTGLENRRTEDLNNGDEQRLTTKNWNNNYGKMKTNWKSKIKTNRKLMKWRTWARRRTGKLKKWRTETSHQSSLTLSMTKCEAPHCNWFVTNMEEFGMQEICSRKLINSMRCSTDKLDGHCKQQQPKNSTASSTKKSRKVKPVRICSGSSHARLAEWLTGPSMNSEGFHEQTKWCKRHAAPWSRGLGQKQFKVSNTVQQRWIRSQTDRVKRKKSKDKRRTGEQKHRRTRRQTIIITNEHLSHQYCLKHMQTYIQL